MNICFGGTSEKKIVSRVPFHPITMLGCFAFGTRRWLPW